MGLNVHRNLMRFARYRIDRTDEDFGAQISSVQFKMISMRSEKPICASSGLSKVSSALPLKLLQFLSD